MKPEAKPAKFVVTGCSRSGTGYASKLLSAIGYECGHEAIFNLNYLRHYNGNNVFVDFPDLDGDSSSGAAPFLHELPVGTVILHQLRNPISCIRSHMGIRGFAEPCIASPYLADDHTYQIQFFEKRFCPEMFETKNELSRCMIYWVSWNRLIQKTEGVEWLHYFRYRIEDLKLCVLRQITQLIGGRPETLQDDKLEAALSSISRCTNSRIRDASVTWETLPGGAPKATLQQCAREYGYDCLKEV